MNENILAKIEQLKHDKKLGPEEIVAYAIFEFQEEISELCDTMSDLVHGDKENDGLLVQIKNLKSAIWEK